MRERNAVVNRDPTAQCGHSVEMLKVKLIGASRNQRALKGSDRSGL